MLQDCLHFLELLKENNHKEWMHENRALYESYKKNYHHFIGLFLERLKPKVSALLPLEIKNCTFRINRDIRFSKDKTPYKTHMGIWFSFNHYRKNAPGFYIHLEDNKSFIAGGFYFPEPDDLKKVRKEIAFFYDDFKKILSQNEFKKVFGELDRDDSIALKTVPKDFEKDHPALFYLQLKSFTATLSLTNEEIFAPDFIAKTTEKLLLLQPLNEFLMRALWEDN